MRRAPIFTLLALAALAATARADTLVLKSGARLEGRVVEQRTDEIVFEHDVGGATVRSTFSKADVKELEQSFSGPKTTPAAPAETAAVPTTASGLPELKDLTELKDCKHQVLFAIDRSGSMAIADRFLLALDAVDTIIDKLPAGVGFGVWVFDTQAVNVFDSLYVKPHDAQRQRLRKRIDALGGINTQGFTDIVEGLKPALHARPEAVYLISDGVPTKGELESARLVKAIVDLIPKGKKIPIHVVAIRGGGEEQGVRENDEVARSILKTIATTTGGKYRELTSKPRTVLALKREAGAADQATIHTWGPNHEFTDQELTFPHFEVEIRDPLVDRGELVVEYANIGLDIRTFTNTGIVFDEALEVPLRYRMIEAQKQAVFGLGGTLDPGPKSFWGATPIRIVRPNDAKGRDEVALKIPSEGGLMEIVYRRNGKSWRRAITIKSGVVGDVVIPVGPNGTPLIPGTPGTPATPVTPGTPVTPRQPLPPPPSNPSSNRPRAPGAP